MPVLSALYYLFGESSLHNFRDGIAEHAIRKFQNNLDRYNFVQYFYFDQETLASKILENKYRKVDGQIKFVEKQYFDRSDGGSIRGVVATVGCHNECCVKVCSKQGDRKMRRGQLVYRH